MTGEPRYEVVASRFEALIVAIFGPDEHPEQRDHGQWQWSLRKPDTVIACWRHENDWHSTVEIVPISTRTVGVFFPDESSRTGLTEDHAIKLALQWMRDNREWTPE